MAYYAKRLQYGAHDGEEGASFVALIEIAKKKGGFPVLFVLYLQLIQYNDPSQNETKMLKVKVSTAKEAVERFWPWGEKRGADFPGFESEKWEKTTSWLYHVAVGGSYECFRPETWVRIGMPAPWSKRRRRQHLQFGNISQILRIRELQLEALEQEYEDKLCGLLEDRSCLEVFSENSDEGTYVLEVSREEHAQINKEIAEIQAIFDAAKCDILATKEEMRFIVRQKFPEPLGKLRKRDLRSAGLLMSRR